MKKQLLKSIALALTLSIMPMASHTMEQPNNEKQSKLEQAMKAATNYVNENGYAKIAYNVTSFIAGYAAAYVIGTAFHESGHALMSEAIKPNSVEKIEIFSLKPHIRCDATGVSPWGNMAISAAGPLLGSLGSYTSAKGLQLLTSYHNTGNFKQALQETRTMPVMATPSKSPFIQGLQLGLGCNCLDNALQMITYYDGSDGHKFLATALYGNNTRQAIPNSIAIPWNIVLGTGVLLATDQAIKRAKIYAKEHAKEIAITIDCNKGEDNQSC